jgi:NAD+-dependent secondary alcohol dehydrogenase Adh1
MLHPGTKAVVFGAGGLGHIAIQCVKALTPAEVVVVDSSEAALDLARSIGADHAVLADGGEVAALEELADGAAEVVFDFVGDGDAVASALAMVRPAGGYFAVGYGGTLEIPIIDLIATEVSLIGNLVGTYNELAELMALAKQGRVRLSTTTYPLEAVNEAVEDLRAGRLRGRGILLPTAV